MPQRSTNGRHPRTVVKFSFCHQREMKLATKVRQGRVVPVETMHLSMTVEITHIYGRDGKLRSICRLNQVRVLICQAGVVLQVAVAAFLAKICFIHIWDAPSPCAKDLFLENKWRRKAERRLPSRISRAS